MIFFTSDTHFESEDTLMRENRPFTSCHEFYEYVINLWNTQAKECDIIYHLGDFFSYISQDRESWSKSVVGVKKINAPVVLIIGNNEERVIKDVYGGDFQAFRKFCIDCGFKDVKKRLHAHIERETILFKSLSKKSQKRLCESFWSHT